MIKFFKIGSISIKGNLFNLYLNYTFKDYNDIVYVI